MEPVNTTALQQAPSRDRSSRAESEFSIPEYRISYGQEHILQWEPPVGSKELAVALSYHFPLQVDLASKMQAATRRFLRQERDGKKSKSREQAVSREPSAGVGVEEGKDGKDDKGGTSTPALQILTWDSGMKSYGHKTKRRRYDKGERVKVAANRGFACDVHRRQKMKCDPERCSRNKQHFNSLEAIPQAHTDTSTKLEDKPMDGRDPSIHSQDLSFLSDHTDSIPQNSDGLSLYSMTTSDTSPRWSISSVMNSTNMSFSDTSNSLRPKHDSIESVLSSYDLEFLANLPSYDVSYTTDPNHDDANTMWWTPELSSAHDRNSGLIQDGYLPVSFPSNQPPYQNENQNQNQTQEQQENFNNLIIENASYNPPHPPDSRYSPILHQDLDIDMASLHQPPPHQDHPPHHSDFPDPTTHPTPPPLTTKEKKTLLKWWGRDRLTEPSPPSRPTSSQTSPTHSLSLSYSPPSSPVSTSHTRTGASASKEKEKPIPSSSSVSESHTTTTTSMSGSIQSEGGKGGRGRKNTLARKVKAVKGVGVSVSVQPPFLRRGIWRSGSREGEGG